MISENFEAILLTTLLVNKGVQFPTTQTLLESMEGKLEYVSSIKLKASTVVILIKLRRQKLMENQKPRYLKWAIFTKYKEPPGE